MKRTLLYFAVAASLSAGSACNNKPADQGTSGQPADRPTGGMTVAYVNVDTLTDNLDFFKQNKEIFDKEEQKLNAEIESLARNLQNEYASFQKKVQSGTLSQLEGEAGQRKLQQMQQNLEERRQTLTDAFMKKQSDFNTELKKRLDTFLEKYNKDKKYDYILSHGTGSQILWANEANDITKDVIKGMNEDAKAAGSNTPAADTAKK